MEVLADVTGERKTVLRPGSLAEMDFSRSEALAGLFLPSQALLKDDKGHYVWVVEDGRLVRRDVQARPITKVYQRQREARYARREAVYELCTAGVAQRTCAAPANPRISRGTSVALATNAGPGLRRRP